MTAEVLPKKFWGWKFYRRPVDCKNLENYIPLKFVRIQYVILRICFGKQLMNWTSLQYIIIITSSISDLFAYIYNIKWSQLRLHIQYSTPNMHVVTTWLDTFSILVTMFKPYTWMKVIQWHLRITNSLTIHIHIYVYVPYMYYE